MAQDEGRRSHGDHDGGGADADQGDTVDGFLQRVAHVSARSLGLLAAFEQPTMVSPPPSLPGTSGNRSLPIVVREVYSVSAEYGRGGMGRVLVARDQRLDRRVAIKELLVADGRAHDRFVREALITARLQHPSIVPVYEAGRWPSGEPFYAMKLVSGRPFSVVIDEARTLDERLALLRVVLAVAEAIAYAHSQRIIHRDLKPDNVLVGEFGETVVIDWGLAKHLDDATATDPGLEEAVPADVSAACTIAGAVVGTPGFMAPEQAAGRQVDERSDVYALGCLIYTLLARRPPYRGKDAAEVVRRMLSEPPTPLAEHQPGVPVDLLAVVDKAMARQPGLRYASARELAADLGRFMTGQLVSAHRYSRLQRVRRFVRRFQLPLTVAGAGLALALGTAVIDVHRVVRERDHARQERTAALEQKAVAEAARAREVLRVDQLVLAQARAALDRDPTLTMALLERLRPEAQARPQARVVAARAQVRVVAFGLRRGRVAAFAPDGTLASADDDGAVRLYHGGVAVELEGRVGSARAIAFSPDGTRLAVGGSGGARLYDVATRRALPLAGALEEVTQIAVADDSRRVAFAAADGVHVCDREGHSLAAPPTSGSVSALAFAGAGRLVVRDDRGALVWDDVHARRLPVAGKGPLALAHDQRRIAVGSQDGVRIMDLDGGHTRRLAATSAVALAFSGDDARLAVCAADGGLATVALADGARVSYSHAGEPCYDVRFSRDDNFLVSTRGVTVRVWDRATGELRKLRGHELKVDRLDLSADGHSLATASADGVRLWRLDEAFTRAEPLAARWQWPDNARLALVAGGAQLVVGGADGHVAVVNSHGQRQALGQHSSPIRDVAVGGDVVASAASDGVEVYNLSGSTHRTITSAAAARVALSADGRWLATLRSDGGLQVQRIDRARAAELPAPLTLASPGAESLALAPDGGRLAAAVGRAVQLFNLVSGRHETVDFVERITGLAFLDPDLVAVAESSGAVELLQVQTGEHWILGTESARVVALAVDAGRLVTLDGGGHERRWPAPPPGGPALHGWIEAATDARLDGADQLR